MGIYHLSLNEYEKAMEFGNRSVEAGPNHASNLVVSAAILNKCGQPERAIERIKKAMRLSPVHPTWYPMVLGQAYRLVGEFDESIEMFREVIDRQPDSLIGHLYLAAVYGETGLVDEAAASVKDVLRIDPNFTIRNYVSGLSYRDPTETVRFEKELRKAKLPE